MGGIKMKITMSELNEAYASFTHIINNRFPIKTSYKIAKLIESLEKEKSFFNIKFQELIQTYSEKDENGAPKRTENGESILITQNKLEEFTSQYNDLLNLEVEIPNVHLTFEELENCDFTPLEAYNICKLLDE